MEKGTHQSPESIAKMSLANKGKRLSLETRTKMSIARMGRRFSPETRAKISASNKGKEHSVEAKAKMSISHKGIAAFAKGEYHHDTEARARISAAKKGQPSPRKGIPLTAETKARLFTPETRAKISAFQKGRHHSPEHIANNFASQSHKQTKPEKSVEVILNELYPNEYKYVGSSGSIVLNHCVPDFININSQKKVIEVFGDYWHGLERTGRTKVEEEVQRINKYATIGFDCLVIWEHEIKSANVIRQRIEMFHNKGHLG